MMNKFVICIDNQDYEASLEKWKVYPVVQTNELDDFVRIIDESGEDYLYPLEKFSFVELSPSVSTLIENEFFS